MKKICTIVGARPQFIKAAPVSKALESSGQFREILVHTGQHYDEIMSQVFFDELQIAKPSYNLGIGSCSHGAQTGRMLEAVEDVLESESPDWVMVYGDTNSTLAGALAASKLHIPVAHVEAGLRSFNRKMPEEINRVLTDHISNLLFAPTAKAVANLTREGISSEHVLNVGDVMYDSSRLFAEKASNLSTARERLGLKPKSYALATIHRAENTDEPARLLMLFQGLAELAKSMPVVIPIHPRTRATLKHFAIPTDGILVCDPVGYLDMVDLVQQSGLICTDSGGLQKEAYFHSVPCLTLRSETEWVELVDLGCNRLLTAKDAAGLAMEAQSVFRSGFPQSTSSETPYGDGHAAGRIASALGA